MPRFQVCENGVGLAFYEGATGQEALETYLRDMLHSMTKLDLIVPGSYGPGEDFVMKGPPDAVLHTENGRPAELTFDGERFYAVPA